MRGLLKQYGIDNFWHFTDKENLPLIEEHGGLFSLAELKRRRIIVPVPGGNDWSHDADRKKGLDKYVHLAFVDDHPMLYNLKKSGAVRNPIWLRIDATIVLEANVRFTAAVANKTGVEILDVDGAKKAIDFDVLFTRLDWRNLQIKARRQAAIKSEILIPDVVPIERIFDYKDG